MSGPARIAIAGVFDIANYGDQLFPLIAAWRLAPHGVAVEAVAPGPRLRLREGALVPRDLDWLLADPGRLDGILIGGGNILYNLRTDYAAGGAGGRFSSGMHSGIWLGACLAAALRDIPFAFNAPGLPYPFSSHVAETVLRPCLEAADVAALRDAASVRLAAASGVAVERVPDTAADLARMWPRASLDEPFRAVAERAGWTGGRYAAIHLRRRADEDVETVAGALDAFCAAEGVRPVLIAIGDDLGDDETARRLASRMRGAPPIVDGAASLREVAAVIANAEVYLGGSLHGYVTAAAYDVPGVIVTGQPHRKFGGFLDWIGRPEDLARTWEAGCARAAERLAWRDRETRPIIPETVAAALDAHWARVRAMLDRPDRRAPERAALLRALTARAVGKEGVAWAMAPWRRPAARSATPPASPTIADVIHRRARETPDAPAMLSLIRGETPGEADSYASLDRAARRIGGALRAQGLAGRAVLLASGDGLSFVRAFLGCLYAGVYAAPVPAIQRNAAGERLRQIARDARPAAVLADDDAVLAALGPEAPRLIRITDALETGPALAGPSPGAAVAFIQYTSGSTGAPRGVAITHENIMANQAMIRSAFGHDETTVVVSWLPLHHDMGLIGSILQPLYLGGRCILMSPLDFLQRPVRWLRAIAAHRATTSGAPNFAYELCLRHVAPAQVEALDLSSWRLAFCGSEPVRAGTMERFAARFAPAGFAAGALYPCYGMAEATLFVAGGVAGAGARSRRVLRRDVADVSTSASAEQPVVDCGRAHGAARIAIVAPHEVRRLEDGEIGEICVAGPHVSPGVWSPDRPDGVGPHAGRTLTLEATNYLRSGDAGIVIDDGLHIVGRLKDIIIVRGANIHAEDVEATLMEQPEADGIEAAAAFALERDRAEALVVLCEPTAAAFRKGVPVGVAETLGRAVARAHGVQPAEIVLLRPRSLPRTTSGKVQRGAARAAWLDGRLSAGGWLSP